MNIVQETGGTSTGDPTNEDELTGSGQPVQSSWPPPATSTEVLNALFAFPPSWDPWLREITQSIFQLAFTKRNSDFLDSAVRDSMMRLEHEVRELTDAPPDMVGVELMKHAFAPQDGVLSPDSIPSAEREGLHQLFRGAILYVRNQVGHRRAGLTSQEAFGAIGLADYLTKIAKDAARRKFLEPSLGRDRVVAVAGVKRVDIDGDGCDELLVVAAEQAGSNYRSLPLVLRGTPLTAIPGSLDSIPGAAGVRIQTGIDFDDDSVAEPIIHTSDATGFAATVVDWDPAESRIRGFGVVESLQPTEVRQPMELGGRPAIVTFDAEGQASYWVHHEGSLVKA